MDFGAWWLWRTYYLGNLPTLKKKLKVVGDWTSDLIFKPGVAMIKRSEIESSEKIEKHSSGKTLNKSKINDKPQQAEHQITMRLFLFLFI